MNATQQFYELVAAEYSRIEELKAQANERGDIAVHLVEALNNGEITQEQYDELKQELLQ